MTETKVKNAQLAVQAFPELVSVDENCPYVSFCWFFFWLIIEAFFVYFVKHLPRGVTRKYTPTGTIEEKFKIHRTEAKLKEDRQGVCKIFL